VEGVGGLAAQKYHTLLLVHAEKLTRELLVFFACFRIGQNGALFGYQLDEPGLPFFFFPSGCFQLPSAVGPEIGEGGRR